MNDSKVVLSSPTVRLTLTYLAIIMVMSIGFSAVFYETSARQLQRPLPGSRQPLRQNELARPYFNDEVRVYIEERYKVAQQELLARLFMLNVVALVLGAGISYFLARKSLQPIERAMENQTQFVSDASHELRTPLTILQTTNEVALRKKHMSPKDARELIEHTVTEVKRLRNLTNSLLSLLQEPGEVILGTADLQTIVSDSLAGVVSVAQAKNISVTDNLSPAYVFTNPALLTQVVTIFLDNAIKYSPHGSEVTVTATHKDRAVRLSVTDMGVGIDPTDIQHIFNRFYRADKARTSSETHGYGLGLSIADKIARQIQATIEVTSTPQKGSTFTIVLPRSR